MLGDAMNHKSSLVGMNVVALVTGLTLAFLTAGDLEAQTAAGNRGGAGGGRGMMRDAAPLPVTAEQATAPVEDLRIFVPMPPEARLIMRDQMKQFLVTLSRLQGLLAEGELEQASELAETAMGRTERGRHRGQGPGRYMPVPMRNLAWGLHDAASEFAQTAATGDLIASYKSLQKIQNSCVACHFSYRNR